MELRKVVASKQQHEPLLPVAAAASSSAYFAPCTSSFPSPPPVQRLSCGAPAVAAAASLCLPAPSVFQRSPPRKQRPPRVRSSSCKVEERPAAAAAAADTEESSATAAAIPAFPPVAAVRVGAAAAAVATSRLTAAAALAEFPGLAAGDLTVGMRVTPEGTAAHAAPAAARAAAAVLRAAAEVTGEAAALTKASAAAVAAPSTAAAASAGAPPMSNATGGIAVAPASAAAAEAQPAAAATAQAKTAANAVAGRASNTTNDCLLIRRPSSPALSSVAVTAALRVRDAEEHSAVDASAAATLVGQPQRLLMQKEEFRQQEAHSEQQQRQPKLQQPGQLRQGFQQQLQQQGQELQQWRRGSQEQEGQEEGGQQQEVGKQWLPQRQTMRCGTTEEQQQEQHQRLQGETLQRQHDAQVRREQRHLLQGQGLLLQKPAQHQTPIKSVWMLAFVCFCEIVLLQPIVATAALFGTAARRDLSRRNACNLFSSSASTSVSAAAAASLLPSLCPGASAVLQQRHSQQQQHLEKRQQLTQQLRHRRQLRPHLRQQQQQLSGDAQESTGRHRKAETTAIDAADEFLPPAASLSLASSSPRFLAPAAVSPVPGGPTIVNFVDPPPQGISGETPAATLQWSVHIPHATGLAGEAAGGRCGVRTASNPLLNHRRIAACSGVRTPYAFWQQRKTILSAPPSPSALHLFQLAATPSANYFFLSGSLPRKSRSSLFSSGALSTCSAAVRAAVPDDALRCAGRVALGPLMSSPAGGQSRAAAAARLPPSGCSLAAASASFDSGLPGAAARAAAWPAAHVTAAPADAGTAATTAAQPLAGGNKEGGGGGAGAEVFPFQAEVKRVLDIIVNSLYTDRDVFLRELISNAADACDKKRVLMQQQRGPQQEVRQEQQQQQRQHPGVFRGSIRVRADREKNTLSIEDDGVGMTRAELISNLGTIAQSGTYHFLEQLRKEKPPAASSFSAPKGSSASSDASLIGQFGVGFYSAFLVANKVEVYSAAWRGRDETAAGAAGDAAAGKEGELELWKWSSTCGQTFQLERVADVAAERQRWLEEGKALRAQFQKQKEQQQLQQLKQDGGGGGAAAAAAGTKDLEKKEEEEEEDLANWSGTRVVLHLKEDCDDYLEDYKLKELLRKYSEFVQLPIYIWSERIEYERIPDTQESPGLREQPQQQRSSSSGGAGGGRDVGGSGAEAAFTQVTPETMDEQLERVQQQQRQALGGAAAAGGSSSGRFKTVTRRYYEWEHLNTQPPIWRRDETTLSDKDYVDFYKSTFKAYDDPLSFVHMKVEGQVEFSALLFVPGALPWELARNMFDEDSRGIRLYVKRVFINDKFADAVPRWLTFIRGVVDSDEMPLNVGREILQKSRMLQVVNKRLAMKAVEMIKKIKAEGGEKWRRFWENYGKYLKVGAVEDKDNQEELASLVQFHSTASPHTVTDLSSYISRMQARNAAVQQGKPVSLGGPAASAAAGRQLQPRQQQAIYYLAAENRRAAEESPALELPKALGYEVIFGTEPLDEFFLASLSINQYKGFQVVDVNKADLKLGAEKNEDASGAAALMRDAAAVGKPPQQGAPHLDKHDFMKQESIETKRIQLGSLCEWLQQILGSRVHGVQITDRLFSSPAVLVQGDFGLSPTMQRYMKQQAAAQGVSEQELYGASLNQPILELNPYHPIIQRLDVLVRCDVTDPKAKEVALQLFDVASLQGGYTIENPGQFAKRIVDMMKKEADAALSEQQHKHNLEILEAPKQTHTHASEAQTGALASSGVQQHLGASAPDTSTISTLSAPNNATTAPIPAAAAADTRTPTPT